MPGSDTCYSQSACKYRHLQFNFRHGSEVEIRFLNLILERLLVLLVLTLPDTTLE